MAFSRHRKHLPLAGCTSGGVSPTIAPLRALVGDCGCLTSLTFLVEEVRLVSGEAAPFLRFFFASVLVASGDVDMSRSGPSKSPSIAIWVLLSRFLLRGLVPQGLPLEVSHGVKLPSTSVRVGNVLEAVSTNERPRGDCAHMALPIEGVLGIKAKIWRLTCRHSADGSAHRDGLGCACI